MVGLRSKYLSPSYLCLTYKLLTPFDPSTALVKEYLCLVIFMYFKINHLYDQNSKFQTKINNSALLLIKGEHN